MSNFTYFRDDHAVSMTLRDYFAAQALQGFSSTLSGAHEPVFEALARDAYRMADAMLKAREE